MAGSYSKKEYALYKGEELLCIGTPVEIAEERGVQLRTIHFYKTPTYQSRLKKRKSTKNALVLVPLDDE